MDRASKEVDFWDLEGVDEVIYENFDEAVEAILDSMDGDPLPKQLKMVGYKIDDVSGSDYDTYILDLVLWWLDAEHNIHSNSRRTGVIHRMPDLSKKEADKMRDAAKTFIDTVLDEYESRKCHAVCEEVIDVREWLKVHHPKWLHDVDIDEG